MTARSRAVGPSATWPFVQDMSGSRDYSAAMHDRDAPRVLVVDDDAAERMVLEKPLRLAGFTTRGAGTLQAAVQACRGWRPHLIVLDLLLPDGSGADLPRLLRAGSSLPLPALVVASGYAEEACRRRWVPGAAAYLTKPADPRWVLEHARREWHL